MAHLVPTLDMALLSAVKNRTRIADLVLQADSRPFLQGARIYHRIDPQPELLSPALLNRFELVIVFPGRGIVCVCSGSGDGMQREKFDLLEGRYPLWGEASWIHYSGDFDSNFWEAIEITWALMEDNPELQQIHKVCRTLNKLMGIVELPPCFPSGQDKWLDSRFIRVVQQSQLQRDVVEQLSRWTNAGGLRLRLNGCAGSGKTMTALMLFRKWATEGRKPMLLCYNHRLGLWLYEQTLGLPGFAGTLFHWARMQLLQHGQNPPADAHHVNLLSEAIESGKMTVSDIDKFDCLIVDEGQDIKQEWAQVLFKHYLPEGSDLVWLEDAFQKILGQDAPVLLDNVSCITSNQNLRTPQHIARYVNQTLRRIAEKLNIEGDIPEISGNDLPGWPVLVHAYGNPLEAARLLRERIDALITEGVPKTNILVLSNMNDSSGLLMSHEVVLDRRHYLFRPEQIELKRYTGEYDLETNEKRCLPANGIYSDSIFKVKGLEEYAVLLMDLMPPSMPCDPDKGRDYLNRLYCSITRAKARLEVFVETGNPLSECF